MRKSPRTRVSILAFTIVFLLAASCRSPEQASAAADLSVKTAAQLDAYYQGLIDDTNSTWDMTAFDSAVKGVQFEQADRDLLSKRISELNKRAKLAKQVGNVASRFQALATSWANFDTSKAISGLGTTLQSLGPMPKDHQSRPWHPSSGRNW
jgi:hypothetical protein